MDEQKQPPSVSEVWAEIKQNAKKEIADFKAISAEKPITGIIFTLLFVVATVAGLFSAYMFWQKTGSIDQFLAWWLGTTLLEKLFDVVVGVSAIFLGGYLVIKQPRLPFPFMLPEKVEQAIIQAPAKVFDCVYYLVKKWLFNNKK